MVRGHIYVTDGQKKKKKNKIMHSFPKTGAESCWKRKLKYENILYNSSEQPVDWTCREFQNQTILFSRKIKSLI